LLKFHKKIGGTFIQGATMAQISNQEIEKPYATQNVSSIAKAYERLARSSTYIMRV
jgi:hypothetical protein